MMKAVPIGEILEFREVEYDIEKLEEIIKWGKGNLSRGPDGSIIFYRGNRRMVVNTGDFIGDRGNGSYVIVTKDSFEKYWKIVSGTHHAV